MELKISYEFDSQFIGDSLIEQTKEELPKNLLTDFEEKMDIPFDHNCDIKIENSTIITKHPKQKKFRVRFSAYFFQDGIETKLSQTYSYDVLPNDLLHEFFLKTAIEFSNSNYQCAIHIIGVDICQKQ